MTGRRPYPTVAEIRYMDRNEAFSVWSAAVRSAATAKFPKTTVALRHAAYVAGRYVVAGRLDEERARHHLHRAARRSGVMKAEAESLITDGILSGRAAAYGELVRGGVDGNQPGAFSAVACATDRYSLANGFSLDPGALALGCAVLVGCGHDDRRAPVAVGVPSVRAGEIWVDAVFASQAPDTHTGDAWTLVRTGRVHSVSIVAATHEWHTGVNGRLVSGTLVRADLVREPADKKAQIARVVTAPNLSPAQRETQRLFDAYLADAANPRSVGLLRAAEQHGTAAMDVLAPVVAPLLEERGLRATGVRQRGRR